MTSGGGRHLHRSLTPGLLMRPPRPDETEEIVDFVYRVFSGAIGEPDETAGIWARDLLRGDHPTSTPIDGTIVVDTVRHRIASCCFLIRQTWSYGGIPVPVGRPELIGTDPAYRGHGLVRAQLAEAHTHGEAHGELMQAITGIPWFYRQFGYEPAIVTHAVHAADLAAMPALPGEAVAPFLIRPATEADLPLIERLYQRATERALVSTIRDQAIWRYELSGRTPRSDFLHDLRIIETAAGSPAGFFAYHADLRGGTLSCTVCEVAEKVEWEAVAPRVLRALRAAGEALSSELGLPFDRIAFDWTPGHPFPLAAGLHPDPADAFAWYIRVPDLPAFIRRVAPVLEARLASSEFAGLNRELEITFYRDGLRLAFANGRLSAAERASTISHRVADAAFPGLTFLQLLFGSRSFPELAFAFPNEARVRDDATRALLATLFPRLPSAIWPVA